MALDPVGNGDTVVSGPYGLTYYSERTTWSPRPDPVHRAWRERGPQPAGPPSNREGFMRINRTALRKTVQTALDNAEAAHAKSVADFDTNEAKHKSDWVAAHNGDWNESVIKIKQAIRNDEPITSALLPHTLNTWGERKVEIYAGTRNGRPTPEHTPDRELVALAALLDVIEETVVTPTGLKALGVNPTVMRQVILKLGQK